MNAVVAGLPRSWHTAPSITVASRGRSRSSFRRRASSMTISVWIQTSPSGCHSGSCGQSTSGRISGRSCSTTPSSRASAKPSDGRSATSSSFSNSPHTRSAGRSSSGDGAADGRGLVVERAARSGRRTAARAARAGCRRRRCAGRRRAGAGAPRSSRPSNGSRYSPVSGSQAMALMVKSRRRAASSSDIGGSPSTSKPVWPRPAFDSRRGSATSIGPQLVDGEALADRLDAADRRRACCGRPSPGTPNTSRSRSLAARPSSRSRTQPPTTSARPPRARGRLGHGGRQRRGGVVHGGHSEDGRSQNRQSVRLPREKGLTPIQVPP